MPPSSEPIFVVSNRLPYDRPREGADRPPKRNVGGLVNAVEPVVVARGGHWVGWDGTLASSAAQVASRLASGRPYRSATGLELHGIPLTERELSGYYHGFTNRALWPLFHDFPGKSVFDNPDWRAYQQVNRRFADVVAALLEPGGRAWIHDYHLMLLPKLLRERGFHGRIDFFLHIPFPAPEIFRALPWRDELIDGVLGADGVGFHVPLYRDNFAAAVRVLREGTTTPVDGEDVLVEHRGGTTRALAAPIGIDVADFERVARRPEVAARARRLRAAHGGRRILLGADRLDYTKGIRERLQAFESLLAARPDLAGRVVLVQIVVPSRHQVAEYRQMRREIEQEVGRINGEHGRDGWAPVHYRWVGLERPELVAHYLAADVALITPLRDGMNLVASEFAASRIDEAGVLLLSEFAGVAERARGAMLVNPYDVEGTARAIAAALELDSGAQRERMRSLRREVARNPATSWAVRCLDAAIDPAPTVMASGRRLVPAPAHLTPEP